MTRPKDTATWFLRITNHGSRFTLLLALTACSPAPQSLTTEFLAMGTMVSITVVGDSTEAIRGATVAARAEIEHIGREWYPWAESGELVRVNAALAAGESSTISPQLAKLLLRAQDFQRRSDGMFDPAVGALVRLWGFDTAEPGARPWPTDAQVAAWRADRPTLADLRIDGAEVRSERRDVVLDLGAIGKGYAVDRAIEILRGRGIENALVNAGGNVRGIGRNDSRPWRIAIRDPCAENPIAWLELRDDESVSTSGDYERFKVVAGRRAHHLLDPRTGEPTAHTLAVTVIAADATTADVASTALFIAGPEAWQRTARALGIALAVRVDANGRVEVSGALRDRLHLGSSEPRQTDWIVVNL